MSKTCSGELSRWSLWRNASAEHAGLVIPRAINPQLEAPARHE